MKKIFVIALSVVILMSTLVLATTIIGTNSRDPKLYLSLGDFLLGQGYREAALQAYEKAYELNPNDKVVLNNLGYYYKESNPLMAESYFLKALELDENYETARNNLALLYNQLGNYNKAIDNLRILVSEYPENIHYNYDLAINLANRFYYSTRTYNDIDEALHYFKIAYEIDPKFEHSLENIKVLNEIKRAAEG